MPDHSLAKLLLQNLVALLQPGETLRLETVGVALFQHDILVVIGLEAVAEYLTREEVQDETENL